MADTFVMLPTEGRGKELCDLLRRELGIPERATWFEVRFARGESVAVKCQYTPDDRSHVATVRVEGGVDEG